MIVRCGTCRHRARRALTSPAVASGAVAHDGDTLRAVRVDGGAGSWKVLIGGDVAAPRVLRARFNGRPLHSANERKKSSRAILCLSRGDYIRESYRR